MCKLDINEMVTGGPNNNLDDKLAESAEEDLFFDYDDEEDEDPSCSSNEAYNSLSEEKEKSLGIEYANLISNYTQQLHKIVNDCHPGEWSYGMDMFATYLRFMKDFYHNGEDVHAMEQRDEDPIRYKNEPTREESLTKALEYYDKWQHVRDGYFRVLDCPVRENGANWRCEYRFRPDGKWHQSSRRVIIKWHKYMYKLEQKYKKKFFAIVFKYLESWWD